MNPKSKEFQSLKNKWYKKLEKSGFEDIEKDENTLKKWAAFRLSRKTNNTFYGEKRVYYESREEYYRQAGWFLHDYEWDNDFEQMIWAFHAHGRSIRYIAAQFKLMNRSKYNTSKINLILKKLAKLMFEKYGKHDE